MCYFITLAVPAASEPVLRSEFARGFLLQPTSNPSVLGQLPPEFRAFLLISGMCSCDLYARPGSGPPQPSAEELKGMYRKRGWSEAKLERAVQASARARAARAARVGFAGLRADVAAGVASVARAAGPIALVVHWYSGGVESERFTISSGPRHRSAALRDDAALIAADTLIWAEAD